MPSEETLAAVHRTRQFQSTWLCPTPAHRERLIDMERRLAPEYRVLRFIMPMTFGVVALARGPEGLIPLATTIPFAVGGTRLMRDSRRPEYVIAAMAMAMVFAIAVTIALTGGLDSPLIPWLLVPVFGIAARFRPRVLRAMLLTGGAVLLGLVVLLSPSTPGEDAARAVVLAAAVTCSALLTSAIVRSEYGWRRTSSLDPLTGLLNRGALLGRFAELAELAAVSDQALAVMVCDLDHFKQVNDVHGHPTGDQVLREVAATLRSGMRSFELVYRLGGEEFLIVLPGAGVDEAATIADALRQRVADARPAGLDVTISVGLSGARGAEVEFDRLYEEADEALYRAKQAGRNRVMVAERRLRAA